MGIPAILAALADETRRNILRKLREGKISSGDLAAALGMTPQALSYHLKKLKQAELIYETKYKNFIYYELDLTVLDEAILWLTQLRGGEPHEDPNPADLELDPDGAALGGHPGDPAPPAGADPRPLRI